MRDMLLAVIILMANLVLSGCMSMPQELVAGGPYADIKPRQVMEGQYQQQRVRWGGAVIQTLPENKHTCFQLSGLTVDSRGEPIESDRSTGRFTACARGFYDPAIYSVGRYVTFTGRINGTATHKIANQSYSFPKLEADQVYLWPKRREVYYVPYPVYGYPYYNPYWSY